MKKITYKGNNYTTAQGTFRLPVPDGYHYGSDSGSGNENWFYIVPENISLYDNHIDAKPFSFAVTTISLGQIPFDVQKTDGYKHALGKVGVLSSDSAVDALIISSNCAFFYQTWTGTDGPYHKMNGVLFAGSDAYKFHIFANYDTPKANEDGALFEFMDMALSWMGKVTYIGDALYRPVDMDSYKNHVIDFIDKACDLVNKASGVMGITMDFDAELRKHFVTMGGLLYQNHNIALSYDSVARIAKMVGKIGGRELDAASVREIMSHCGARSGDFHDYIESYSSTSVIKQLTKLDKMGNFDFYEGLSYFYIEAADRFLQILCLENHISFAESDIYIGHKIGNRLMVENVWDSINIQVFSGGSPIGGGIASPREPGVSTPYAEKRSFKQSAITETPAITCTKVKKSECTIDEFGVFEGYNGLDDEIILPSGIEEIGSDAFSFNKTLRIVVIPEGVREIGNDAFWGCEALEQVFLPSTLEKIEYNAFRNCESLTEIIIPDGVWSIGMDAFTGCKNLKDIYVPSSVISVEMDAFYTFNEDTVIHTPQWSSAETYAEEHDMRVDHRQAPVRVVPKAKKNTSQTKAAAAKAAATTGNPEDFEIVDGVLKSYKGQEEHLIIPDGIHTIAEKAFDSIYNLKTIVVPEGVHTIEDDALHYCWQLESVALPSTLKVLSGFAYLTIKKLHIPVGVETIGINAFKGCGELRKVILPPSVTQIEKGAFAWCSKKKDVYIPESVTSIADDAFNQSPRIVIHVHPGSYAEEFAKGHKVKFDNDVDPYLDELKKAEKGPAKKKTTSKGAKAEGKAIVETTPAEPAAPFSLSASGKTLNKYEGKETVVVVPDGVTEISSFAFSDTKVTSVTLPDSVKKIGQYAFNGCTKLEQIRIPESVTSVGGYAFAKCSVLKEITWPGSIKKLPDSVCDNCNALETVVIEEGVTEIEKSAFSFCGKLKDIFLPVSVEKIGDFMILMSGNPTFHVYLDSYGEKYAKENNLPIQILLTPEQEAEKKRQEDARRIAEEKYAAELKDWEQACGEVRILREQRVSELLEEKRAALKSEAQSTYDAAIIAANKRKEAAQQKKADAEMRLSTLGIFKFSEKKAAKAAIEEAVGEIQAAETALVAAKQTLDKDLAAIPTTINSRRYMIAREVEHEYPLPAKPEKPL